MHWIGSVSGSSLLQGPSQDHSVCIRPSQSPENVCADVSRWELMFVSEMPPTMLNEG